MLATSTLILFFTSFFIHNDLFSNFRNFHPLTFLLFIPLRLCVCLLGHSSTEGRLNVNMSMVSLEEVERSLLEKEPSIAPGGYWKPKDCLPRWKVGVNQPLPQGAGHTHGRREGEEGGAHEAPSR